MKQENSFPGCIFAVILAIGATVALGLHRLSADAAAIAVLAGSLTLAYIVADSVQVAGQWSMGVVSGLGRLRSLVSPQRKAVTKASEAMEMR